MKKSERLKQEIDALPHKPGVYQYFNADDEIIYVGKAKDLKKRVSSYFDKVHDNPKTNVLVKNIHHLRFRTTDSTAQWKNYDPRISYYYQPQLDSLLRGAGVPYALYRPSWVTQKLTCADRPEAKVYISSTDADTAFLRMAGLKTLAGDARQALLQPDKAVITASVAQKLFGCSPAEAIGRSFVSQRIYPSIYFTEYGHTVGAVVEDCKDPEATNLGFEAIFPLTISDDDRQPNNSNFRVLIHTDRPEEVTETLRRMQMHEMDAATYCGVDPGWLKGILRKERVGQQDILLMLCSDDKEYTIIKKQ